MKLCSRSFTRLRKKKKTFNSVVHSFYNLQSRIWLINFLVKIDKQDNYSDKSSLDFKRNIFYYKSLGCNLHESFFRNFFLTACRGPPRHSRLLNIDKVTFIPLKRLRHVHFDSVTESEPYFEKGFHRYIKSNLIDNIFRCEQFHRQQVLKENNLHLENVEIKIQTELLR